MSTFEPGLMMDFPLSIQHFIWRMQNVHPEAEVVSVLDSAGTKRTDRFGTIADRSVALAASLAHLGINPGDRVGTFAFNSSAHFEAYLGVMSAGAVLHTLNLRLHDDQIVWMVNHAQDTMILLDTELADQFLPLLDHMPSVHTVAVIGAMPAAHPIPDHVALVPFEELVREVPDDYALPLVDELAAAALCYTSGTTGDPKGVLYSHRSIAVHSLIMSGADVFGVRQTDTVLATVPLFHAMGWGLPFIAVLTGARLVMPGRHVDPQSLYRVISEEGVTWSSGVPTIWLGLLRHIDNPEAGAPAQGLATLRKLILGGTQVPEELIRRFDHDFGTEVVSGWGMTEIFPGATVANPQRGGDTSDTRARQATAGRISPFYQVRLRDDEGNTVPHDGTSRGEIQVRGPAVASGYFRLPESSASSFDEGWLRTGDVATLSPDGWITLVDRAKDMIKSGGEWIPSAELEAALQTHPAIREVAVVGRPDPRWGERPVAFVVADSQPEWAEVQQFLADRVPRWWAPDEYRPIDSLPLTTTGKYDKKTLRQSLAVTNG